MITKLAKKKKREAKLEKDHGINSFRLCAEKL